MPTDSPIPTDCWTLEREIPTDIHMPTDYGKQREIAAMAILGLIITKQIVECMEIDYKLC